ncbi:predicted protein [Histoplasma capsulatum H143]|uniref:Uncharacterized protein n=1 Tax=Ajellomyces capsulatus (strain H143) TaxID=544712 RepID=C6HFK3_AJECH|nr:predicted protein [Histoplasma capsulatum H143]
MVWQGFLHSHDQRRGREHVRWAAQPLGGVAAPTPTINWRGKHRRYSNSTSLCVPPPRRPQRMSLLEGECKAGENPISKDSISYQETDSRGRVVVVASQDGSGVCGAQGSASRSRVDTTQGTPPKSNFHNDGLQPSPFCFSLQPAAQQELRP